MRDRDPPEENEGVFKKHALSLAEGARPARPPIAWCIPKGATIVGRAERTEEYVSTVKGQERRWRHFSTLHDEFQLSIAAREYRVFSHMTSGNFPD